MIEVVSKSVKVELLNEPIHARLIEPLYFQIDARVMSVPIGYETDFASVPRLFWNIVPPIGKYTSAAIIHDYLYDAKLFTRVETDNIFYTVMRQSGVGYVKAKILYGAVRMFGGFSW